MDDIKERKEAARNEVAESTIANEAKAALLICNILDIALRDIDWRIRKIHAKHGLKARPNGSDLITGMANYSKAVRNALYWFERNAERYIMDSTMNSYGVDSYDWFRESANEIAQLILLTTDRCNGKENANLSKVFDLLKSMPTQGWFTDEDINRFQLK